VRISLRPISLFAYTRPRLGGADKGAQLARARYKTYFGPLSHAAVLGNHSLVFVDAPQLVEDERTRAQDDEGAAPGHWRPKAAQELVKIVDMGMPYGAHLMLCLFSHDVLTARAQANSRGRSCSSRTFRSHARTGPIAGRSEKRARFKPGAESGTRTR
jgi:hypothetical protein